MDQEFYAYSSAIVDERCKISKGVKILHFSHIMTNCVIGENCNIGQNVVISPEVVLGKNVKIQNNVSISTGVACGDDVFLVPSCVFTNVTNPRSGVKIGGPYLKNKSTITTNAIEGLKVVDIIERMYK